MSLRIVAQRGDGRARVLWRGRDLTLSGSGLMLFSLIEDLERRVAQIEAKQATNDRVHLRVTDVLASIAERIAP